MANGKKAPAKKTSKPRNQITRRPKSVSNFDGQNLLVSQYFEVELTQPANGEGGVIAYSIACDVNKCILRLKPTGGMMTSKHAVEIASTADGNGTMSFERFTQFKALFRQYKVNAVSIAVTADRECGLDNPVIFLTDKGEQTPAPLNDIGKAMAQPHKQHMLTESRRTCKYGWKPKTAQEKEYQMVHSQYSEPDLTTIKVLQEVEPKDNGKCTHKVAIRFLATLKDGKALTAGN